MGSYELPLNAWEENVEDEIYVQGSVFVLHKTWPSTRGMPC
jgi:hypothetical protein